MTVAGDWIKMRGALIDHPKVIAVSRRLQLSELFRDWLTPGSATVVGQPVSNEALRCVTTALLMRVWSVAREHGKFDQTDLILRHSELADLDEMAGAPGLGDAMKRVGWAIELSGGGIKLPNFKEFNVPMTPAEKQRDYRYRQQTGNDTVTKSLLKRGNGKAVNVTTREEKRRDTPIVPTPEFLAFWTAWPKSERKGAKGECLARWVKLGLNGQAETVIAHVESMKLSRAWTDKNGQFIPAPLAYLNGKSWVGAEPIPAAQQRMVV